MISIQDKDGKAKKITASELLNLLKSTKQEIETATGYAAGYLKHGQACDSSDYCLFRMDYVRKAERKFVLDNQAAILANAAKLVQDDIDTLAERQP